MLEMNKKNLRQVIQVVKKLKKEELSNDPWEYIDHKGLCCINGAIAKCALGLTSNSKDGKPVTDHLVRFYSDDIGEGQDILASIDGFNFERCHGEIGFIAARNKCVRYLEKLLKK